MASNERSRQQSAEAPQAAMQQQGGSASSQRMQAGDQLQARSSGEAVQRGSSGRAMPAMRGFYEPSLFGGAGGPFAMMRRMSEEMDRMFEHFGIGRSPWARDLAQGSPGSDLRTLWSPNIEVCERDGRLVIQADLPGMRKEDVTVQVEPDAVVIHGERRHESKRDENGIFHTERSYGRFRRVIPLPDGVDTEQARASFHDGVLEIELPAPPQQQRGRRLAIEERPSSGRAKTVDDSPR